jgi:hypothetical protein
MTNVTWALCRGIWDQNIVEAILPSDAIHLMDVFPPEGGVVIIPAGHCLDKIDWLNQQLAGMKWVLAIMTSDEESSFPTYNLKHPRMRVWVQHAHPVRHIGLQTLPNGYPAPLLDHRGGLSRDRSHNWMFAGQVTHPTRQACVEAARKRTDGFLHETDGFARGIDHTAYYAAMKNSKVVLCPSGPCTPDSFRVYEALELGCVPIVDRTPGNRPNFPPNYWEVVLPGHPFPVIDNWANLDSVVDPILADWERKAKECSEWWKNFKLSLSNKLIEDIAWLQSQ